MSKFTLFCLLVWVSGVSVLTAQTGFGSFKHGRDATEVAPGRVLDRAEMARSAGWQYYEEVWRCQGVNGCVLGSHNCPSACDLSIAGAGTPCVANDGTNVAAITKYPKNPQTCGLINPYYSSVWPIVCEQAEPNTAICNYRIPCLCSYNGIGNPGVCTYNPSYTDNADCVVINPGLDQCSFISLGTTRCITVSNLPE